MQRGCDKFCSFCIVPFTRGRERGVPPKDILRQAREMAERGFKEVTLLGQTVNSYQYEDVDFADLLEQVVDRWARAHSIHLAVPDRLHAQAHRDDRAHDKISQLPAHAAAVGLGGDARADASSVHGRRLRPARLDIRAAIPDIALSTDIIVGFPGETDEDFEKTMQMMREIRFDFAYMFKYSERSNTHAARNKPDVSSEEVKGKSG